VTPQENKASFIHYTTVLLLSHSSFINTAEHMHGTSTVKQVPETTIYTIGVDVETLPPFIIVIQA